jgi:hypothetical protein
VLRCLEKDPERRYPDVKALDAALQACADAHAWSTDEAIEWWRGRASKSPEEAVPLDASSIHTIDTTA